MENSINNYVDIGKLFLNLYNEPEEILIAERIQADDECDEKLANKIRQQSEEIKRLKEEIKNLKMKTIKNKY